LRETSEAAGVPVLTSSLRTAEFIHRASAWLEERLAPETQVHANLLDVQGVGILIRGPSGIGKSEAALDLVARGARLVADDVVIVRRIGPSVLRGRAARLLAHHMEIRGLGVLDVEALFGTLATLDERQIDLVVELIEWSAAIDRLGLVEERTELLEASLPIVRLPVQPGRSLALLIESAARNHLLRRRGRHSAQEFAARVEEATTAGRPTRGGKRRAGGGPISLPRASRGSPARGRAPRCARSRTPASTAALTCPPPPRPESPAPGRGRGP